MKESKLAIIDAIDNLTNLIEADSLEELEATEDLRLISHKGEKKSYWVHATLDKQMIEATRESFRTIYQYLEHCYSKKRKGKSLDLEGLRNIMVLVGEAARKLERFGKLFQVTITQFPEYLQLQDFYQTKLAHEREKGVKAQVEREVPEEAGVHLLDDIDLVKKDQFYELFSLKNEEGHDFYSSKLARKIKLYCDFGEDYVGDDPLLQVMHWKDHAYYLRAKALLKELREKIKVFYEHAASHKEDKLIAKMNKALMALQFASHASHLLRQGAKKSCYDYFHDFLSYFRDLLHDSHYSKLVIYGASDSHNHLLSLAFSLLQKLYTASPERGEVESFLQGSFASSKKKSEELKSLYLHLQEKLRLHPDGPLFKALDVLDGKGYQEFDPYMQGNLPCSPLALAWGDEKIPLLTLPAPVHQHEIGHTFVIEEFTNYLLSFSGEFLYIQLEDPTSWKNRARTRLLEELALSGKFSPHLTLVHLPCEGEFYENVGGEGNLEAFSFLVECKKKITEGIISARAKKLLLSLDELLSQAHSAFGHKKSLTQEERRSLLSLLHALAVAKLIELLSPISVAFGSKDGLDKSSLALVQFLTLFPSLQTKEVASLLFAPTLLARERLLLPEDFARTLSLFQLLEKRGKNLLTTQFRIV